MRKLLRHKMLAFSALVICMVARFGVTALAEVPKPAEVPKSWELKFRFEDPQRVAVYEPGQNEPTVYWYMLYRVENATDQEVDFYPRFDLITDTLDVVSDQREVSPEAFKAIRRRAGQPFLLPPEKVAGKLLIGEERARYGVAIWKDFDPKARAFAIYVHGLSGEWTKIRNPAFDEDKPSSDENPRYFVLRKTLKIPYRFPGSESMRHKAVPQRIPEKQTWVMR